MKIKIICHTCVGSGCVKETEWGTSKEVFVVCPECEGKGYITAEKYEEEGSRS